MATYNISKIVLPNGDICNLKAETSSLEEIISQNEIIVITPNFSSLPQTFYDSRITENHELVINGYAFLSDPEAKIGNWEINFYNGYYTINGLIDGTTSVIMSLHIPSSKQVGIANA